MKRLGDLAKLLEIDRDLHAPPPVRFNWGPMEFFAVIEKLGRKVDDVPSRRHAGARRRCRSASRNTARCASSSRTRAASRPTRPSAASSSAAKRSG